MCPTNAVKQYQLLGMERDASEGAHSEDAFVLESKGEVRGIKFNNSGTNTGCRLMDEQGFGPAHEERALATSKLTRALALCLLFMSLEIVGGYWACSLAVLADAAHMLSDVTGFAISLLALRASGWLATPQQTFGYFRVEVLGALVSVQIIWVMTGIILYEAFRRLHVEIQVVDGRLMVCVACVGLVLNFVLIFVLGHTHDHGDTSQWHGHCHSLHEERNQTHHDGRHVHDPEDGHSHGPISGCCKHGSRLHLIGFEQSSHSHLVELELGQNDTEGHKGYVAVHGRHEDNFEQKVDSAEEPTRVATAIDKQSDLGATAEPTSISGLSKEQVFEDDIPLGCKSLKESNINLRGAYLHALGDLIQNIGVLITGLVIWVKPEWQLIDLLCCVIFSAIVLMTTLRMLKDILRVLMESPPRDLDVEMLSSGLLQIPGVSHVLDLHVWTLTPGTNVLSCHVGIKPGAVAREVLHDTTEYCYSRHQIKHVTFQIEEAS